MREALHLVRVPRSSSRLDRVPVDAGWWAPHATLRYSDSRRLYDLFDEAMCFERGQRSFLLLEQEAERWGAVVGWVIGCAADIVRIEEPLPLLAGQTRGFDDETANEERAYRLRRQLPHAFRQRVWYDRLVHQLRAVEDVFDLLEDAVRMVPVMASPC